MNNQIKYIMVAFVAIISIASCKKEIDYSDPNSNGCQLKSWKVTSGSGELALNFEYDAIGRVIKETNSDGDTYSTVYTTNKITATDQDGIVDELILSNGKVISSGSGGIITAGILKFERTKKYDYNADGYLTQVRGYENDILISTTVLTYSDGNLVKSVATDASTGDMLSTTTFRYRSETAVNISWAMDPLTKIVDYYTGSYFGKPSKNFLAAEFSTTLDPSGNPYLIDNSAYAYQFDAKGNATAINITSTSTFYNGGVVGTTDTSIDKYEFTYNCK
ncbi:DUF4595 domain-containing protein [Pedobacter sp. R20-19]|uniref:DUF4595 domain-containing protein n=1 Tax=Pedobacter sp. R20-19 TaxID=1270196 RepID=UPI000493123F|nr:DUF4595 domain-containing protein [Pedobacter sp. R20-19]